MYSRIVTILAIVLLLIAFGDFASAQQPDSMYYEVVQTNPPLGTPPSAQDGFCSSNGGALGCDNLQKYRLLSGSGNDIVGNWLSAGADVAPLLQTFYDSIYTEFRNDNTYEVQAVDPNGVTTTFLGTYTASPSGFGNIYTIVLQQTAPYAATVEGIFEINPAPITDIDDGAAPLYTFELQQNYPNPFNPSTTIRFQVPQKTHVSLRVFNALGQEVAELMNETVAAGMHTVEFDAGNLPSGVYFYRIQAGTFISTRQMVLTR